jgi:hypothetical protein
MPIIRRGKAGQVRSCLGQVRLMPAHITNIGPFPLSPPKNKARRRDAHAEYKLRIGLTPGTGTWLVRAHSVTDCSLRKCKGELGFLTFAMFSGHGSK